MDARLDDDALLAGMAAGDTIAAGVFIRRHASGVTGVAMAIVADRQVAEDIAQETFWRAWRAAGSYDVRRGRAEAWLLAIARHAAIDHVRVYRPPPLPPETLAALLRDRVGSDDGPEEIAVLHAEGELVRRAVSRLPDEQRRALLMTAVAGRTAAEVSEVEGIPLGTAKTRIRTALRRVRRMLDEDARRGF